MRDIRQMLLPAIALTAKRRHRPLKATRHAVELAKECLHFYVRRNLASSWNACGEVAVANLCRCLR